MSGLPNGWVTAPLSELADFNPKHDPSRLSETVSFVPMPAVSAEFGTIEGAADRPLADVWKGFTHFAENDVIFAKITPCMENGKIAVAQGLTNGLGCGSTEFHVLRSNGAVLPEYLWRFLRKSSFRKDAEGAMTGAVGQRRVSTDYLKNSKMPVPPLAEQGRIVAKLDALTAHTARARADLDRIPALAARYKQAVLAKAFSGELVPFQSVSAPITIEGVAAQIFDGPFGSSLKSDDYVPSGVRVIRLENIAHLRFVEDKETYITEAKFGALRRHSLQPDDVLFSSFVDEQVRVCVLPELATPAINKADCFCVRLDRSRCNPRFLAFRLASPETFEHFEAQVHGATRPRINLRQLKAFEFDLPPLGIQEQIVRRIDAAFAEIDRLTAEAAAARRLLDRVDQAILARAFRGELVPQDPADEPASVLLERIRAERAAAPKPKRGPRKAVA